MERPSLRSRTALPEPLAGLIAEHVAALEAKHYAATTVRSRRRDLLHFARWCGVRGLTEPCELTLPVLERYRHTLFHTRKTNGQPLGWGAQTQKLLAVKQFLRWATRMHVIGCDVGAALELPRRPQHLPRGVLSVTEVERVLAAPDLADPMGVRDRAILETLYSTGMRRLELIHLALPDIDAERGVVYIREGKGKKDRVVPIGERALDWLQRYRDEVRPLHVVEPDPGTLFLTRRGQPLATNRLTELVHRYVTQAGIAKTGSCHLFRHTMATLMLENGADVRYLQALLGHAQLSTTELYTRVSITQLKAVHQRTHPAHRTLAQRALRRGSEEQELLASLAAEAAHDERAGAEE
jgi:integrase/recombinase XerD